MMRVQTMRLLMMAAIAYTITAFPHAFAATPADTAANRLLQEAVALMQQADEAASPREALRLYRRARQNLDRILEQYPSSSVAVRLVLGDPVAQRLDAALQEAEAVAAKTIKAEKQCWESPTYACVIALALAATREIEPPDARAFVLPAIAEAQAQAGDMQAALTTARSILRSAPRCEPWPRLPGPRRRPASPTQLARPCKPPSRPHVPSSPTTSGCMHWHHSYAPSPSNSHPIPRRNTHPETEYRHVSLISRPWHVVRRGHTDRQSRRY